MCADSRALSTSSTSDPVCQCVHWVNVPGCEPPVIRMVRTISEGLDERYMEGIKRLFDAEYYKDFGPYDPFQPYGYAPSENRVLGIVDGELIGHVGWSYRLIRVGGVEVGIGGVGGVLVSPRWRNRGVAKALLSECVESMKNNDNLSFGYLGCSKEMVAFYEACEWQSIFSPEVYRDQRGNMRTAGVDEPLLIYGVNKSADEWPQGTIDIRGRAW